MAALRATNVVLTLKEGVTVAGVVVDVNGRPVPNVRIKERNARNGYVASYIFTNQTDGRFELKIAKLPPFY